MNYGAAVTDFFKSPRWPMNLLLGGICGLIPIIGPIVLTGWLITGFWARQNNDAAQFPDFDFANFTTYLERGLWPFLVILLVSFVMVPIFWVMLFVPLFGIAMFADSRGGGCFVVFGWLIGMCLFVVALLVMSLVITPLKLRATLTQNFGQAFNIQFAKRFLALVWKETILAWLFLLVVNLCYASVGMLLVCVGIYFVMVPMYFALMHLTKQLYGLYLARGGEPVPISPKLSVVS